MALAMVMLAGCVTVNYGGSGVRGRGNKETYTFNVGEITEIKTALLLDIDYYSASSDIVTLEIQPNLRDYVIVEESGGVLTVRTTRNINVSSGEVPLLKVSTPALKSLSFAGAGSFTARDKIIADEFSLRMDGAGSGKAELDVDKLTVDIAGAGSFQLSGRADDASFGMAGAGSIEALSLQTKNSTVDLAGVGTVRLSCSDNLKVIAAGMGTVEYIGSPAIDTYRGGLVTVRNVG